MKLAGSTTIKKHFIMSSNNIVNLSPYFCARMMTSMGLIEKLGKGKGEFVLNIIKSMHVCTFISRYYNSLKLNVILY